MNRGEIAARISSGINDPDQVFMTPADLALTIDDASEVMAEDLGAVRRTLFVEQRPGTTYYHLHGIGPDLIAPFRIWDHARNYRLPATSLNALDERMRNWPTASGEPSCWFPVSWDCFGIWPRSTQGGGVLRLDCYAWPRSLMDDDDEPEMIGGDQDALVAYGIYEGLVKRWDADKALQSWAEYAGRRDGATAKGGTMLQAKSWQRSQT
jgi:hypothetical protein